MPTHRKFGPKFRAKVVLEVLMEQRTAAEVCREHSIKPDLFSKWKSSFVINAAWVFQTNGAVDPAQARIADLERLMVQEFFDEVGGFKDLVIEPFRPNLDMISAIKEA